VTGKAPGERVDASVASPARIYDYLLGGKDNFEVDRESAELFLQAAPTSRELARSNRAFLVRAVRFLTEQGVDQFIDLGTGFPTSPNVHEVARETFPAARIVYVDNDPMVLVHNRALRDTHDGVVTVRGDVREPDRVLADPVLRGIIDLSRPVAVLAIAVLHFVTREENATTVLKMYRDALVAGSYLAVTALSTEGTSAGQQREMENAYQASAPVVPRSRAEIAAIFDGVELVEPGLVEINGWRADDRPVRPAILGGVGALR